MRYQSRRENAAHAVNERDNDRRECWRVRWKGLEERKEGWGVVVVGSPLWLLSVQTIVVFLCQVPLRGIVVQA